VSSSRGARERGRVLGQARRPSTRRTACGHQGREEEQREQNERDATSRRDDGLLAPVLTTPSRRRSRPTLGGGTGTAGGMQPA